MTYSEIKKDILTVPDDYWLAYTLSADFQLKNGLAARFNNKYLQENWLMNNYGKEYLEEYKNYFPGDCLSDPEYKIFNLVVKERHHQKATLYAVRRAMRKMKEYCNVVLETSRLETGRLRPFRPWVHP